MGASYGRLKLTVRRPLMIYTIPFIDILRFTARSTTSAPRFAPYSLVGSVPPLVAREEAPKSLDPISDAVVGKVALPTETRIGEPKARAHSLGSIYFHSLVRCPDSQGSGGNLPAFAGSHGAKQQLYRRQSSKSLPRSLRRLKSRGASGSRRHKTGERER